MVTCGDLDLNFFYRRKLKAETPMIYLTSKNTVTNHYRFQHTITMSEFAFDKNQMTVMTPINKSPKSVSNCNYREQLQRESEGNVLMWDDAKGNPTQKIGGAFAFVHNNKSVDFHVITRIYNTDARLPTWANNIGQGDRNVLYLTPCLYTMDWDTWKKLVGPATVQRTIRVVSAHDNLSEFLDSLFKKMVFNTETGEVFM